MIKFLFFIIVISLIQTILSQRIYPTLTQTCFGIASNDTKNVCSGHGTCKSVDNCQCNQGYTHEKCQTEVLSRNGNPRRNMLKSIQDSDQVIIVTNADEKSMFVNITAFERNGLNWTQKFYTPGVIGKQGWGKTKEGDEKSPIGKFTISGCFGKYPNPRFRIPYRQCSENDVWVDDPESLFYNSWQTEPAQGRWKSSEKLLRKDELYDYACVIDYNIPPIPGKGSAIFFHIWNKSDQEVKGTMGCTATAKNSIISILNWLDYEKKPIIIQGPFLQLNEN